MESNDRRGSELDWHEILGVLGAGKMGLEPTDTPMLLRDVGTDDI